MLRNKTASVQRYFLLDLSTLLEHDLARRDELPGGALAKAQLRTNRRGARIADWWQRADLVRDIGRALLVALVAGAIGLLFNVFVIWPRAHSAADAEQPVAEKISMTEAYQMTTSGEALMVDAEDPEWHQEAHIAGAINLPGVDFEQYYPQLASQLAAAQTVIVYCEPGCMSKDIAADELLARGHRDVRLMEEGVEEWEAAGYPVSRGPARAITDE